MMEPDKERLFPRFLLDDLTGNAMAEAVAKGLEYFCRVVDDGIGQLADPDRMTEKRLDELAGEYGIYYDYGAELETKRELIRNAYRDYAAYGTKWAVKKYSGAYLKDAEVIESKDGLAHAFWVSSSAAISEDAARMAADAIEATKNVRSSFMGFIEPKRYGFRVKQTEANPNDRVEYLFDAVGMTPAGLDSNDVFQYGDWEDIWFVKDNFPCMVKSSGEVDYKLDRNNHALKENGTASDAANTAYDGNAMSAIPLCWVKRYTEGDYRYIIFCQTQYDETYKAYAHTRPDGSISKYMFMPMFKGSLVNGKLRSLSGQRPQSNTTATEELEYAKANGERWGLRTWMADELISDLLTLMAKNTNLQMSFGNGHARYGTGEEDILTTGTLAAAGQFAGETATVYSQVKAFYIEGFWGDRQDRQEGCVSIDRRYYVKPTPENGGYSFDGIGYIDTGLNGPNENGYIKEFSTSEYGSFPTTVGASSTTFECDYYYANSGKKVSTRGDSCASTSAAHSGRAISILYLKSTAQWYIGASPFLVDPT